MPKSIGIKNIFADCFRFTYVPWKAHISASSFSWLPFFFVIYICLSPVAYCSRFIQGTEKIRHEEIIVLMPVIVGWRGSCGWSIILGLSTLCVRARTREESYLRVCGCHWLWVPCPMEWSVNCVCHIGSIFHQQGWSFITRERGPTTL